MTNEECVLQLEYLKDFKTPQQVEALDLAIKALEQQPCEDCISRQAVLDVINFEDEWLFDAKSHNADTKIAFSAIKSKISELPSVTPRMNLAETSQDCISRKAVDKLSRDLVHVTRDKADFLCNFWQGLDALPSVKPTNEDISEAYIKGYDYGVKDWFKSKTQSCEDAVSRSELLSHDFIITAQNGISHRVIYATRVEEAPSVTPERPKGKWKEIEIDAGEFIYKCTKCGMRVINPYKYCPMCGSYNGGGEDEG